MAIWYYTVTVTVTDQYGGKVSGTQTIAVAEVAPSPAIQGLPASVPEGTPLLLSAAVTDPSPADVAAGFTYAWTVTKDGQPFALPTGTVTTAADFSFTPLDNGSYVVTLAATDRDGVMGTVSQTVTVTDVAPKPSIIASAASSPEGTALSFTSTVADVSPADTKAGFGYTWSITKDGSAYPLPVGTVTDAATFSFTPVDQGAYVVTLAVTDNQDHDTATASAPVTVTSVPPVVVITGVPVSPAEESPITLGIVVTDPSSNDPAANFTYAWTVLKGGKQFASGTTSSPTFTPDDAGVYEVDVTVTDSDGGQTTTSATMTVVSVTPTVAITGSPETSPEGTPITLGSTVTDPSHADPAANFTYAWSVTKDGAATPYASGAGPTFTFTPDDNATYAVTLSVTDSDGGTGTAGAVIVVTNVAPTARIDSAPTSVVEGTDVNLTGSATDPSPADTKAGLTLSWVVTRDGVPYASGSGTAFSLPQADEGTYTVALAATDQDGGTSVDSRVIIVTDPAVVAAGGFPVGAAEGIDSGSQTVATFTDPAGAELTNGRPVAGDYTASIDWGDGQTAAGTVTWDPAGKVFVVQGNHAFTEEGGYPITVTIHHGTAPDVTVTSIATVAEPPLAGNGLAVAGFEGLALTNVPVATFSHGGTEPGSGFGVTIDWGDGTTSMGTAVPSGGVYVVLGSHTYGYEGRFIITTTVTDDGPLSAGLRTMSTAIIREALLPPGSPNGPVGTAAQRFVAEVYHDLFGLAVDAGTVARLGKPNLNRYSARLALIRKLLSDHHLRDLFRVRMVQVLFKRLLGRAAGDRELAAALRFLARHDGDFGELTRLLLMQAGSPRASVRQARAALEEIFYLEFLGRPGEKKGLAAHVFALEQGRGYEQDLAIMAASDEFFAKTGG
jgi:hypothetical protein